jgi:hypothetical protein
MIRNYYTNLFKFNFYEKQKLIVPFVLNYLKNSLDRNQSDLRRSKLKSCTKAPLKKSKSGEKISLPWGKPAILKKRETPAAINKDIEIKTLEKWLNFILKGQGCPAVLSVT